MKVSEEDNLIGVSNRLLASLYSEIASVQTFKAKWSLVKSKLDEIRSQLAEFSESSSSEVLLNPISFDLVSVLVDVLRDAVSLAGKCQSLSFVEGKLRTQSEIDSVIARLDRAARDGEILIRSGILSDAAVSSSASRREAARSESRSLVTRLQIGAPEAKSSAMDALLRVLGEDDKNVVIAVAQGVVPAVVRTLDSPGSSPEMKEKAVAAIARVSIVESGKQVLIAEGLPLLNHLLRVLDSGSGFSKEKSCIALQSLTFSRENARAIGSRGGILSLLEICRSGTPGSQASAAGVLRNLAAFPETKENFVEENAIVVLLALASSGTAMAQENSVACLCNLITDDETLKLSVIKENGIECLKNFWDSSPSPNSLEVAVELLGNLATISHVAEDLISHGFIPRISAALTSNVMGARISAAKAAFEIGGSRARKEIGESGCVGALTKMLDGKAAEEKEAAAKALSALMQFAGNRKVLRQDEKGIASLVQLLDPASSSDKKYAVAVLTAVSQSKKCRREMIAAGAGPYLQRLVEKNVEGSKKLLDCLKRGKLWGVFGRA